MALEIQLAAVATGVVLGFFQRLLSGASDQMADRMAGRVVDVLDGLGRSDPVTRSAMDVLRASPGDRDAGARLQSRIEEVARFDPVFRAHLSQSMIHGNGNIGNIGSAQVNSGVIIGHGAKGGKISLGNIKHVTHNSGALWLLVGAGLVIALMIMACGGVLYALARDHTTFFDTKTLVEGAGGWSYRVSEAHIKTSPQLESRGPAKPGYRYIYFDITVENLLKDREAPGIQFHFARSEKSMSSGCGAVDVAFIGPVSSYEGGIVPGWCLSRNGDLFAGGASCFETNDSFFQNISRIPPGGKNQVRCVDSYLAKEGADLSSLRVFYLGVTFIFKGAKTPYMKQIPTEV